MSELKNNRSYESSKLKTPKKKSSSMKDKLKKAKDKYKETVNKYAKQLPGPAVPPAGIIRPGQRYKCGGRLKK